MLKKIICLLAVLLLVFSFTVSAEEDFWVYGDDTDRLCEVLNMNEDDIKNYCAENNITYLAVNSDNTKQVRRVEVSDAFAQKTVDLSVLSDSEILELSGDISGFEGVKGTVVEQGDYKFLKVELQMADSGGDYILTQYTTVKNAKRIVLSFYTMGTADRGYTQDLFAEQFKDKPSYEPIIIIGIVLFAFAGLVTVAFIVKDLRKGKEEADQTEEIE